MARIPAGVRGRHRGRALAHVRAAHAARRVRPVPGLRLPAVLRRRAGAARPLLRADPHEGGADRCRADAARAVRRVVRVLPRHSARLALLHVQLRDDGRQPGVRHDRAGAGAGRRLRGEHRLPRGAAPQAPLVHVAGRRHAVRVPDAPVHREERGVQRHLRGRADVHVPGHRRGARRCSPRHAGVEQQADPVPVPAAGGTATEVAVPLLRTITVVTAGPTTATVAAPQSERNPLLDNAKVLAIALVVVGHAVDPMRVVPAGLALYATIYAFHMPVFILVSGYLSRSFTNRPRQAQRVVTGIVVPYLVFEASYEVLRDVWRGTEISVSLLTPSFAMWFLIALLIWRVSAPLWNSLRPAYAVALAVAVSLLAGATQLPATLDLARVLGFLPFYVLGLTLPDWYFDVVRSKLARYLAVPTLLGALGCAYLFGRGGGHVWFFYNESYADLGVGLGSGIAHRAAALAIGLVLLTAFLAVVPRGVTWFTGLGVATMYVYVLHRFLRKAATSLELYDLVPKNVLGLLLVVAVALGVTLLLSSRPVRFLARPFVEPRLNWLFRGDSAAGKG
ncbi:MAG: acyltransferase family protein [Streptosporangiales bacterium]|nr:acyltransferase family protein [Streptosporangiales bacterium]